MRNISLQISLLVLITFQFVFFIIFYTTFYKVLRVTELCVSSPGYYVPNDDGEFYQFCYVTHKGEIRGASTPFQFRANSPSEDELLTVEDECNSDILVVTTKAGYLEVQMPQQHYLIHQCSQILFGCHIQNG